MLKFRKINENAKKSEEIMRISSEIDGVVNQWISDLKRELITGSSIQNRGIWDRFKNFIANVWHGYDNENNPYYSINKLGYGLGSKDKNESMKSYNDLRETCQSLESKINEEDLSNLRIMQIIDKHANMLKTKMKEILIPILTASSDAYGKLGKLSYKLSPEEEEIVKRKDAKKAAGIISDPIEKPIEKTAPKPIQKKEEFNYTIPPTTGKRWEQLTSEEKNKWNIYGGGLPPQGSRIPSPPGLHGIDIPIILRTGDPRIALIRAIKPSEADEKSLLDNLIDNERVELKENPISSKGELEIRKRKALAEKTKNTLKITSKDINTIFRKGRPEKESPELVLTKPVEKPNADDSPTISTSPLIKPQKPKNKHIDTIISELEMLDKDTEKLKELYEKLPDSKDDFDRELNKIIIKELDSLPEGGQKEHFTKMYEKANNLKEIAGLLSRILSDIGPEEGTTNESFSIVGLTKRKILKFRQLCQG
jgi:hypothetical protein